MTETICLSSVRYFYPAAFRNCNHKVKSGGWGVTCDTRTSEDEGFTGQQKRKENTTGSRYYLQPRLNLWEGFGAFYL